MRRDWRGVVLTALERKRMVEARQKNSSFWRLIHLLGSLQLALILLATIAIACAAATVAESEFSTKVAQVYIYKAPWFLIWLGVLCINLFAVTITRWPWEKKHTGFIVTHYGIITLLFGAIVGLQTGFEGNVTLHKDKPPVRKITINRSIIQVESPNDTALYVMPFDAASARPSEKRPRVFEVPASDLKIVADAVSENLLKEEKLLPSESGAPGVMLRLTSPRMGQTVNMPLVLEGEAPTEKDFFGLAKILLQSELPPPSPKKDADTQVVFGRFAPVVQDNGPSTGVKVLLSEDGKKVTIISPDATSATYLRADLMKSPLQAGGVTITIEEYWPDFEMREGRPSTKSDLPNNPAALVRIQAAAGDSKPALVMVADVDGIRYQLQRGGTSQAAGKAKVGDSFSLGWADWQLEVIATYPKAAIVTEVKPGPVLPAGESGIPGFRARLVSPSIADAPQRWVPSGDITALTDGRNVVRIGYGLELRPIPFTLKLVDFEVPRYEGTETPSNFIATLEFKDNATGEVKAGTARMNHPASFPGTFFANFTGINYKFSQAEWNPRDLGETTLQVLYDPGWILKWSGSLAICIGIAIMFYFKPKTGNA
ncbi:MAG: cytochrome C biogenesis protein ResB [Spartobacteria bacterium]|nr:cytochrome C biogenesis protein ResB [Spartobacteria bacterium]